MAPAREVAVGVPYFNAGLCADPDCAAIYDVTKHRSGCPNCSEPGFLRLSVPLGRKSNVRHRPMAIAR